MIQLGDKVKDIITGFTGIAIGKTTWIYGCSRITVQPVGLNKEGKTFETQTFDEPQLQVIATSKIKVEKREKTGGYNIKIEQKPSILK